MRTGKNLFDTVAVLEVPQTVVIRREGRNSLLVNERNKLIAARLYWYRNFTPYREDIIKTKLENEFFLTWITMQKLLLLDDHMIYMRQLKNQQPAKNYFQEQWPHIRW